MVFSSFRLTHPTVLGTRATPELYTGRTLTSLPGLTQANNALPVLRLPVSRNARAERWLIPRGFGFSFPVSVGRGSLADNSIILQSGEKCQGVFEIFFEKVENKIRCLTSNFKSRVIYAAAHRTGTGQDPHP